jgi:hypothetical protein
MPLFKNTTKCLSILIVGIIFSSCANKDTKTTPEVSIFGFRDYESAKGALGKYAEIFQVSEGSMQIDVTKIDNSAFDVDIYARFMDNSLSQRSFGGDYFLGDIKLAYQPAGFYTIVGYESLSDLQLLDMVDPYFGQNMSFKLVRSGQTIFEDEFYVPQRLKIENLKVSSGNVFIPIDRNNFSVKWNADPRNENGLVAYIVWTGNKANESPNDHFGFKEIGVRFTDNGSVTIPSSSFLDIPKNALFSVFFIRGNIATTSAKDGRRYKVYVLSQDKYSFQMIN